MLYIFKNKAQLLANKQAELSQLQADLQEMEAAGDYPARELNDKQKLVGYARRNVEILNELGEEVEISNPCLEGELGELEDGRGELHSSANTDIIMDRSVLQHLFYLDLQAKQ